MNRRAFLPLLSAALLPSCGKPENSGTPAASGSSAAAGRKLIVGMDMTYPPFEFKNEKGEPDGVDVKIAEALAAHLGRPLQLEAYAFDGLIPALQAGKIDLVISAMTATDERRKSIDFSDPYVFTALAMLVGKDTPVQTPADLQKPGLRIIAKIGTTGESYTREHLPQAALTLRDDEVVCVQEVANGAADVFIYDQLSIYKHAQNTAGRTRAILTPIRDEAWGIGIKKGNDSLRTEVNAFIKHFRDTGGLNKLADIYLTEERKLLESLGSSFIFR